MAEDILIFSVGDVVWLKSGGPAMTVTSLDYPWPVGITSVEWFVNDLVQRDHFCTDSLTSKNPNKAI